MKLFRLVFSFLPLAVLLPACDNAPAEQAAQMVNLQTVQSGPRIQAQELDGAISRQPGNAALYARRAAFRLDAGQSAAALQDIDRALEIDDSPGEYYFTKARALRSQGRLPATLAAAQEASKHGFSSPELNLLVGEANLAARNYEAALDHLDRTLQQEPDHAAALFYKGLAYVALTDTVQALDYLRASLIRDPQQPEILHQLAFLSNAFRLPAEAAAYSARGLKLDPTYAPLWYDHGRQFDLLNQPDSALRYYAHAAQLDTTLYRADYRLALNDYKLHRYAAALPRLQRALRRAPRLPNARLMLAESFESLGRYPEAADQYRRLVAENPGNKHWTYKAWKTGNRARGIFTDTIRRAATAPVAPLSAARPSL